MEVKGVVDNVDTWNDALTRQWLLAMTQARQRHDSLSARHNSDIGSMRGAS